ncbi:hypothetical protein JY97_14205 [Alkalispirochaeta odontotermitis]|nr:hypothetical protein JY97_14205 [Alkalispirochaeta odontotermitis]CAB1078017.1 hypothetical protein D1AOALGA4SA_5783 [Olavius algarvensis Delta 1 endosymbiont]
MKDDYKFQKTNHKYQTNYNDLKSKFQTSLLNLIESNSIYRKMFWSLDIGIFLLFGAWGLGF